MSYKVIPISTEITSRARATLVSPQYKSLKANVSVADGYGPCRSCLQVFDQGTDRRIYFTYNSFDGRSGLPDPGPVFIHENDCERFEGIGFPEHLNELPVLFEAFGEDSNLLSRTALVPDNADGQIASIFREQGVKFINLRNAEAGCFIATVERG
jgi:hypothetical protein